jgi:hypothetical protein
MEQINGHVDVERRGVFQQLNAELYLIDNLSTPDHFGMLPLQTTTSIYGGMFLSSFKRNIKFYLYFYF